MKTLLVILIVVFGLMLWVRLAPTDPAKWHQVPAARAPGDYPTEGSFTAVRRITDPTVLDRLKTVALATPRTQILAESDGLVTFVTRSLLWGFPDYTTAQFDGQRLTIYGRLRFGRGDFGVNRKRITAWLAQLGLAT